MDAFTMHRLGFAPDDAAEVLRTMPPRGELAAECDQLAASLAHRSQPGDGPPPKPPENGLRAAHVILASLDAIRDCHRSFGVALGFWDWLRSVFGAGRPKEIGALRQETRLQRAVVEHLRAGKHWRLRTGWFEL